MIRRLATWLRSKLERRLFECPKCLNWQSVTVKYSPATDGTRENDRLEVSCGRCRYMWRTFTADAPLRGSGV